MGSRPPRLTELPPRPNGGKDHLVHVVIETPKGSPNKLGYDPELGVFTLHSVMPQGMSFPFDFGFIPGTVGGDGDPLDVLVLMEAPVAPGVLVRARLVGVIEAEQTEKGGEAEKNDRLIAAAPESPLYAHVMQLSDLPSELVDQVEHFFVSYNAQHGKTFTPRGQAGAKRAERTFQRAHERFLRKHRKGTRD